MDAWNDRERELLRGACRRGARKALTYADMKTALAIESNAPWVCWGMVASAREGRLDIVEDPALISKYRAMIEKDPWLLLEVFAAVLPRKKIPGY